MKVPYCSWKNVRAPDKLLYLEWVKKDWNMVSHDVFVYSFKACRTSSIAQMMAPYSVKPGGIAHSAVEAIAIETLGLSSRDNDNDEDHYVNDSEADLCSRHI